MMDHDRIFELMERLMNEDLSLEGMERFQQELEDEFFRQFFNTLKKTVELCHCFEEEEVPETLHIRVVQIICNTPQENPRQSLPNKPRKKTRRKK